MSGCRCWQVTPVNSVTLNQNIQRSGYFCSTLINHFCSVLCTFSAFLQVLGEWGNFFKATTTQRDVETLYISVNVPYVLS